MKKILLLFLALSLCFTSVANAEESYLGKVQMEGEFISSDVIKLTIKIADLSEGIIGGAFNLLYPSDDLLFLRYDPGTFLEQGGDPLYLVKNTDGKIFAGITLRRNDSFPDGEGVLLTFYFQLNSGDNFDFTFDNGVLSTLKEVRQDLEKISWESLTMKRGDGDKVVYSSNAGGGYQASILSFGSGTSLKFLLLVLSTLSGLLLIVFLKKRDDKRAGSSVNFK